MHEDRPRRTLILASVSVLLSLSARAQSNLWIPTGPGNGFNTTAIAVDPDRSTTMFLGTDKGEILRSEDAGGSWRSVHLEAGSFAVSALAISPTPAPTIYAVFTTTSPLTFTTGMLVSRSRVLRSIDGGDTWEPATNGLRNLPVLAIAVDPFDPFRVYAGAIGGVFRSDDRGRTWSDVSDGLRDRNIQALVADPTAPGTLYAGAAYMFIPQSGGLFRTTDGGIHWSEISESLLRPDQSIVQVRSLAAGATPRSLYASVRRLALDGGTYYPEELVSKSIDGGNTWSLVGSVQPIIIALFVDPISSTTAYASGGAGLLWKTTDGGTSWNLVVGAGSEPVAIDPRSGNRIYAPSLSRTALLAKSENGGASWTDLANGLRSLRVTSVATDSRLPATVYCGTSGDGVFKSMDGGATWKAANAGLGDLQIVSLTSVPWTSPILFAVTGSKQVYRSADGAETWTPASGGLPPTSGRLGSVVALVGDPTSFGTLYAAIYGFGAFKTTNLGDTWTPSNDGLTTLDVRAIAVDPLHEGVVYAATGNGVFKSTTGGSVWAASSNGLGQRIGYLLAIDPLDSSVVYVATSHLELYHGGPSQIEVYDVLYRSVDGSVNWTALSSVTYATRSAIVDPASGALYVSTFDGVVRSIDRGVSWEALKEGLPSGFFTLALAPGMPPTLYAANEGGTLFRLTLATPGGLCVPSRTALCLNRGRFRVEANFNARNIGIDGDAPTVPLTDEAGGFWFFSPQNVEVVVKVVDGTSFNGRFWVFAAGLSNVEYTLTVTDTAEGSVNTYFNPSGRLESLADAGAFPSGLAAGSTTSAPTISHLEGAASSGLCEQGSSTLCLNGGRFNVTVEFHAPSIGQEGAATAVPWTTDTGYFWFFSPQNIELVVKVLDGRAVNGHFWVFYGTLTDLDTTITVVDTQTGNSRTYVNPAGSLTSAADTAAF